jgi:hypothetical protein
MQKERFMRAANVLILETNSEIEEIFLYTPYQIASLSS